MTSVLFAESLREDGSFDDEQTISGAAGTAFLGQLIFQRFITDILYDN
jgi:hypothetical protein